MMMMMMMMMMWRSILTSEIMGWPERHLCVENGGDPSLSAMRPDWHPTWWKILKFSFYFIRKVAINQNQNGSLFLRSWQFHVNIDIYVKMEKERKFARNLTGPGSAARVRETVSVAVRESSCAVSRQFLNDGSDASHSRSQSQSHSHSHSLRLSESHSVTSVSVSRSVSLRVTQFHWLRLCLWPLTYPLPLATQPHCPQPQAQPHCPVGALSLTEAEPDFRFPFPAHAGLGWALHFRPCMFVSLHGRVPDPVV